jgi:hypothetical protein
MGRVEFFEPLTSTSPINLSPPRMTILSISKPQIRNPNIELPAFAEAASRRQAKQIPNSNDQIF